MTAADTDAQAREIAAGLRAESQRYEACRDALAILHSLVDGGPRLVRDMEATRWLTRHAGAMLIDRVALVQARTEGWDAVAKKKNGTVKDLRWCATDLGRAVARVLASQEVSRG